VVTRLREIVVPNFTKYALAIMPSGTSYVNKIRTALVRAADTISRNPSNCGEQRPTRYNMLRAGLRIPSRETRATAVNSVLRAIICCAWGVVLRTIIRCVRDTCPMRYNMLRIGISVRLEDPTSCRRQWWEDRTRGCGTRTPWRPRRAPTATLCRARSRQAPLPRPRA